MGLLSIFAMTFLLLLAATALGFFLGRARWSSVVVRDKAHLVSVESAVLGLLALLLGFTFAMAVSRYEVRRQLVVKEANAIGTALLRSRFLAQPHGARTEALLRRYLDLRIAAARHVDYGESRGMPAQTQKVQQQLWAEATALMLQDNRSLANALFVQNLNELIDTYGERTAALRANVPGAVVAILHLLGFVALSVVGYVEALGARQHAGLSVIVATLIAVVMTLIIDLDRPREGLVETSQQSMLDLKQSLN